MSSHATSKERHRESSKSGEGSDHIAHSVGKYLRRITVNCRRLRVALASQSAESENAASGAGSRVGYMHWTKI